MFVTRMFVCRGMSVHAKKMANSALRLYRNVNSNVPDLAFYQETHKTDIDERVMFTSWILKVLTANHNGWKCVKQILQNIKSP